VLNKYTIIGLIVGCVISGLGVASMIDSFTNPIEIRQTNDTFGIGDSDKIRFNAPANSFQTLTITGDTFDVKILTTDEKNNIVYGYKNEADISWVNTIAGENVIKLQNPGNSELNAKGTLQKSQDPLFLTYHILVIIAGIVVIGFSAAFTVRKPRGF